MSSRRRLCGTANAGSGGDDPVATKPIGSAALGHARTDRFVETVQPQHQNARSHGRRPTSSARPSWITKGNAVGASEAFKDARTRCSFILMNLAEQVRDRSNPLMH